MGIALTGFSFAAPVRMVDWIHDYAAHMRPLAFPSIPPCLSNCEILMVDISDLADGCHTSTKDPSHLAGLKPHLHIITIAPHHLSKSSGAADQLAAFAQAQFDIVNRGAQRHAGQGQAATRGYVPSPIDG